MCQIIADKRRATYVQPTWITDDVFSPFGRKERVCYVLMMNSTSNHMRRTAQHGRVIPIFVLTYFPRALHLNTGAASAFKGIESMRHMPKFERDGTLG